MEKEYLLRLAEAIDRDGRTANRISIDAGLGRNYLRSILEEGKKPGIDQLHAVLNQLKEEEKTYVLIGHSVSKQDLEFIQILSELSPSARQNAILMFRSLVDGE